MNIICKAKKRIEVFKAVDTVLHNLKNIENFVVQFEIDNAIFYEIIEDEDCKELLKRIASIMSSFLNNYFIMMVLGAHPGGGIYLSGLAKFANYENEIRASNISFYVGFEAYKLPPHEVDEPINVTLIFSKFLISLDILLSFLYKLREEYMSKKLDDIYYDILDFIIEQLNEIKPPNGEKIFVLYKVDVSINYFFDILLSFSESLKLRFTKRKDGGLYARGGSIYLSVHKSFSYSYNERESVICLELDAKNHFLKKYPASKESIKKVMYDIFYDLSESIVAHVMKEKKLSEIFLRDFLAGLLKKIDKITDTKVYFKLPKYENRTLTSVKDKIVFSVLWDVIHNIKKNGKELKSKWGMITSDIFLNKKTGFYIDYKSHGGSDEFCIEINYRNPNISILGSNIVTFNVYYWRQHYNIELKISSRLYSIVRDTLLKQTVLGVEEVFSDPSINLLLEAAGINAKNKRYIQFLLRKFKMEFLPIE